MSIRLNTIGPVAMTVISATDALSHHFSQNSLDTFTKSLSIHAIASMFRIALAATCAERAFDKVQKKTSPLFSMGILAVVVGALPVLTELNQKKPAFQTVNQWISLLSFTIHLSLSILSKARLKAAACAAFDAYAFYRTSQQSWLYIKSDFTQKGLSFRCTYEAPLISSRSPIECLTCTESSKLFSVSDKAPFCPRCAGKFFEQKLKDFRLINLHPSSMAIYAQRDSLPLCPMTRRPLSSNFFSLYVLSNREKKLLDIHWIDYQVDQTIHVKISGLSEQGLYGHLKNGTQVDFCQSHDDTKIGQTVCGKIINKTVESEFLFLSCSISENK